MNLKLHVSTQKGIFLPLIAIAILVILATGGLVIDLGQAYVNKTKLQSAVDAVALSTVISLWNNGEGFPDGIDVTMDGRATFQRFTASPDNANLSSAVVEIKYWNNTTSDPSPGSIWATNANANTRLARARVNSLTTDTMLMRVVGLNTVSVSATAVAGLQGITCGFRCSPNSPPSRFAIPTPVLVVPGGTGTQVRIVLFKDPDGGDA